MRLQTDRDPFEALLEYVITLDSFQATKEEVSFNFGIFITIAAVDGIFAYGRCIQLANSSFVCFRRIGSTDELTKIGYRIVFFQDGRDDGTAAHKIDQFSVERSFLMYGIEFAGLFFGEAGQVLGHHTKNAVYYFFCACARNALL